jgi:cytoskeletal protein CcmA (bactofilin family)
MKTHSSPRLIAALIITASFIPFVSLAAEFRTGDSPMYEKSETVNDDLYLLGGSVTSSGDLRGDLITFGGNILINGTVLGDIAAGGGNISILSQIHDDVRVAGGTVIIQGGVTGDILAAGGQITISSPKVGGDVTAAGGVVRLDAPDIAGDVRLAGGDVRINSTAISISRQRALRSGRKRALPGPLRIHRQNRRRWKRVLLCRAKPSTQRVLMSGKPQSSVSSHFSRCGLLQRCLWCSPEHSSLVTYFSDTQTSLLRA